MSLTWLLRRATSRTWLLRGAALAVFAMLVGAWALSTGNVGETDAEPPEKATPASPVDTAQADLRGTAVTGKKPSRARSAAPTPNTATPISVTSETPAGEVAGTAATAAPKSPQPPASRPPAKPRKPRTTKPPSTPSGNPPSTPPANPSNPPDEKPTAQCTELGQVLNCVLAPITRRP